MNFENEVIEIASDLLDQAHERLIGDRDAAHVPGERIEVDAELALDVALDAVTAIGEIAKLLAAHAAAESGVKVTSDRITALSDRIDELNSLARYSR